MDYAKAKTLVEQHAPELHLEAEVPGQRHVNVRKAIGEREDGSPRLGDPFSIMLPMATDAMPTTPEQEDELFLSAISAAKAHL